jgi:surface polysaccharide O-acyltransferase-like enzyme
MHINPDDAPYLLAMALTACATYLSLTMPPKPSKIRYLYIGVIVALAIIFFILMHVIPDPLQLLNVK